MDRICKDNLKWSKTIRFFYSPWHIYLKIKKLVFSTEPHQASQLDPRQLFLSCIWGSAKESIGSLLNIPLSTNSCMTHKIYDCNPFFCKKVINKSKILISLSVKIRNVLEVDMVDQFPWDKSHRQWWRNLFYWVFLWEVKNHFFILDSLIIRAFQRAKQRLLWKYWYFYQILLLRCIFLAC